MTTDEFLELARKAGWQKSYVPGSRAHYFLFKEGVSVEVECLEGPDPFSNLPKLSAYVGNIQLEDIPLLLAKSIPDFASDLAYMSISFAYPEAYLLRDVLAQILIRN